MVELVVGVQEAMNLLGALPAHRNRLVDEAAAFVSDATRVQRWVAARHGAADRRGHTHEAATAAYNLEQRDVDMQTVVDASAAINDAIIALNALRATRWYRSLVVARATSPVWRFSDFMSLR